MTDRIRIKQYEQAADEKVSIGGIKWQRKWDVCIQCDSREEAEAFRARLAQPEPAECDGGQCGIGGYCKQCPKTQPEQEPVAWGIANTRPTEKQPLMMVMLDEPEPSHLVVPLYTAPPQREWQGLTDEEREEAIGWSVEHIEAKLKEKNAPDL